jgi:hypothetical protein
LSTSFERATRTTPDWPVDDDDDDNAMTPAESVQAKASDLKRN